MGQRMAADAPPREINKKEQFEALGKFVQSFEDMVDEARIICMDIFSSLSGDLTHQHLHRILLHIVFYHQSITAKPVFEITRAMIGQILNDREYRAKHNIDDDAQVIFFGALTSINTQFQKLVAKRNDLLHATWNIGSCLDTNDSSEFSVYKPKSNKDGFIGFRDDLPKTAAQLLELSRQCENLTHSMDIIYDCLPMNGTRNIKDCFRRNGNEWECIVPARRAE
jgi:hypothetical protein